VGSDDVQIKFRAPKALKDAIDRASEADMSARTATAWLIAAALEKLSRQGVAVGDAVPKKRGGRT
jgi:hypothetical protein